MSVEKNGLPVPAAKMTIRPFFQMADRAPADEGFGDVVHFDRALQPGDDALFFERVLQRQAVDDGRKHPHIVTGGAVNRKRLLAGPAKEVSAADDDGNLQAEIADFFQFTRNAGHGLGMNAEALRPLQGFSGKFQDDAIVSEGRRSSFATMRNRN